MHAAGVLLVAPFEATTPAEFQPVIDVNLMGQVHGAMAALPHLRGSGGALIHISSMGAKRGVPLQTAYCASKHGIDGFVETLRMEVQRAELPIRSAKALILGEKLAPRLIDALLVRFGFEAHDTGQPKPADAPDNLFSPLDPHNTARNGFDATAWPRSLYTTLQQQPLLKRIPLATEALAMAGSVLKPLIR